MGINKGTHKNWSVKSVNSKNSFEGKFSIDNRSEVLQNIDSNECKNILRNTEDCMYFIVLHFSIELLFEFYELVLKLVELNE